MYDKQQSFDGAKKVKAIGLDGNNKFTVIVADLEPSTTYYYKAYVQNGMAVKYGAVKSFTTKESMITVEMNIDAVEFNVDRGNGQIAIPVEANYSDIKVNIDDNA